MLKPSKTFLASGGGLHYIYTSSIVDVTPSVPSPRKRRSLHSTAYSGAHRPFLTSSLGTIRRSQTRKAHTSSIDKSKSHPDLPWPKTASYHAVPTPYEIFGQHPSAPYSKRRFFELVKLYHPDSHSCNPASTLAQSQTPETIRLQRYRLIIEANAILSCPDKRRAYDTCGAGWHGMPDIEGIRKRNRANSSPNHDASRCATWEDWEAFWEHERWRREHPDGFRNSTGRKWHNGPFTSFSGAATGSGSWFASRHRHSQRRVYASNESFVALIVLFTVIGAAHELGRAGRFHKSFLDQVDEKHDATSKELMKRRRESREWETNDARVKHFLNVRKEDNKFKDDIHTREAGIDQGGSKELQVNV